MFMERGNSGFDILRGPDPADQFELTQLEARESCIVETDDGWFSFMILEGPDQRSAAQVEIIESTIASLQPGDGVRIDGAMVAGLIAQGVISRNHNLAFTKFIRYDVTPEDIAAMGEQNVMTARRTGSFKRDESGEYMVAWDGIWRCTATVREVWRASEEAVPTSVFS